MDEFRCCIKIKNLHSFLFFNFADFNVNLKIK